MRKKLDTNLINKDKPPLKMDYPLLVMIMTISLFGVVIIYSASSYVALQTYDDAYYFVKKQLIGFVLGTFALLGMWLLDYRVLFRARYVALGVSIALLAAVFIPGVGIETLGARRWINLPGFSMQASDPAKFGYIIFCAGYMAKYPQKMRTFLGMFPVLISGGVLALLIILEPNMSITMCVLLLMFAMMFIGGAKIKHFALLSVPLFALVPLLIIAEPYRLSRLAAFLNPWESPKDEGFQLIQSFYSLASGGWFGLGLFNSRQKYLFLPFAESDFIFAIIGEELGLVGAGAVLLLFLAIIVRIVKVGFGAPDRFSGYLCFGIAAIIAIQTLVNIAVVTGSIPPTGLPLPFISSGNTSLVVFMASIGIVLNVARHKKEH